MIDTHPILFVGAGPGDPELITVKGQKALASADLVVYAGSLVPRALLAWARPGVEAVDSAGLHLEQIIGRMVPAYRDGKRVVRLHTGDPSLYGAVLEQMEALDRESVPYRVIPGVTAAFAAAAALGTEFTVPEVSQTLILTRMSGRTPVPEAESLESLARHGASMAIYLSAKLIEEVAAVLSGTYGPDAACAVVVRASHPDERVILTRARNLAERVRAEGIDRQAVILVGRFLEAGETPGARSRLYDPGFRHGFRNG